MPFSALHRLSWIVLACMLMGGAAQARDPAAGLVLVAARDTGGPFQGSLVYLLSHDANGSHGLIVNRPTQIHLTDLLPELAELQARKHRVLFGGPVGMQGLKLLIRSRKHPGDAVRITEEVFTSSSPELLEGMLRRDVGPEKLRVFVGYAGWAPDQLNQELARKAWYVIELATDDLFSADESLWERLIDSLDPPGIRTRAEPPSLDLAALHRASPPPAR